MKYGIWKVSQLEAGAVNALVGSGYAPLAAMVLASRGIGDGYGQGCRTGGTRHVPG